MAVVVDAEYNVTVFGTMPRARTYVRSQFPSSEDLAIDSHKTSQGYLVEHYNDEERAYVIYQRRVY